MKLKFLFSMILVLGIIIVISGCTNQIKDVSDNSSNLENQTLIENSPKSDNLVEVNDTNKGNIGKLPDFCSSIEECQSYCPEHIQECEKFCNQNPSSDICAMGPKSGISGVCSTLEECDVYCSDPENMLDPLCKAPSDSPHYGDMTMPELSLSFNKKDYKKQEVGIWPFCVHGGDHPEGHGGIDFELNSDTKIVASADGVVEKIETIEENPHGWGLGVFLMHGQRLMSGYECLLNLQVKKGDSVKKGQFLGNPCKTNDGTYFFHYEIGDVARKSRVCPIDYIDNNFKSILNDLFKDANYPEQSAEPDICNCEALPLPNRH